MTPKPTCKQAWRIDGRGREYDIVARTRRSAINSALKLWFPGYTWEEIRKAGYRPVKVTLTYDEPFTS